jgi:glycosyltransferase involved in cell wall biosynthesis
MQKIFLNHIPKTAGTTFYEYLSRFYDENEIYPKSPLGGYESIIKFEDEISNEISFIASHKNIRDFLDDSWNVITFVRDPKERLVSLYNHWRTWTDEEIEKSPVPEDVKIIKKLAKEKSLVEFIEINHPLIKFHFVNGMAKNLIPINKHKILNNDKKLLKEAKKQIDKMCFVGVVENFKESQLLFEYIFNLPHENNLQDLNKREYILEISESEKESLEKYLKIDNEIYEYAVDKFYSNLKSMIVKEINLRVKQDSDLHLFFLHIMKTGGTSLIDILKNKFNIQDVMPERYQLLINSRIGKINDDHKKLLEDLRNHPVYAEKIKNIESKLPEKSELIDLDFNIIFDDFKLIADHTTLHTVLPKNWQTFTFLRDPEKRLQSHLNDLKSVLEEDIEKIPETLSKKRELMFDIKRMSADDVFNIDNAWIKQTFHNNQTRFVAGFFGKPQDFYDRPENNLLDTALKNLDSFLTVGITERMFESVALVHYKAGLGFEGNIPISNNRGKYDKEKISKENLDKVIGLDLILYKKGKEIFEKDYIDMLMDFVNSNFESKKIEKKETFLMVENFIGTGWHQREGVDIGHVYRWTGPSTESVINLSFFNYQLKGGVIHVISAMHSDLVRDTNIYINDEEVETVVEDVGGGHFTIKFKYENLDNNLTELKIETPYVISHSELGIDLNDKRKKGLAVEKIVFDLGEFIFHKNPVLLCHSLGTECGIATYTEMLSKSNNIKTVKTINDLGLEVPSHIHLQHEFGIVSSRQMEEIIDFCKKNNTKLFVTMHTVLPGTMNFYSLLLTQISFVFKNDSFLEFFKKVKNNVWNLLDSIFSKKDDKWRPGTIVESWEFFKNQNLIIKNADKIFAHSESAKSELEKQGATEVELFIHPTIIFETANKKFSDKDGKKHIGFFGFFNRDKKILDLIQAVKQLDNVVLHLYSCVKKEHDIEYYELVSKEVDKNPNIVWHKEFIPLEKVIFELSKCDLLVWNSKPIAHYSSSGSVRQYLAAKRPILARKNNLIEDLRGIINIVDDININTIKYQLENNTLDMGIMNNYLEKYTWDNNKINYD